MTGWLHENAARVADSGQCARSGDTEDADNELPGQRVLPRFDSSSVGSGAANSGCGTAYVGVGRGS